MRNKILKGVLLRKECNNGEVYEFLKLLKKPKFDKNQIEYK